MEGALKTGSYLAPAKVNLFLKVLGKRPDGFHELLTLMQPVALYDEIDVSAGPGGGIAVETDSAEAPGGEGNLAHRAAALFLTRTGLRKKIDIAIRKRIPVGAGLGGGSSDAATVLMALDCLLATALGEEALVDMASRLGSDVPFFILGSPALARGRGETLTRAALPEIHYVLVNPGFHLSTAWAYSSLDLTKKAEDNNLLYSYGVLGDLDSILCRLSNDLEAVSLSRYPEISALKGRLKDAGALGTLMSGSGPTVFGVFRTASDAGAAFGQLREALPGAKVFLARGL